MPEPASPAPKRSLPLLAGAGVFVVVLGFGLPRLVTTPDPTPTPEATPAAQAAPATAVTPPVTPAAGPGLGVSLLRFVVSMAVVCGLCVLAARYLVRRPADEAAGTMELLASLPVGPQCAVHLVRAGGRRLLLGTDPAGVKVLVELPGPEPAEPAAPAEVVPAETAPVVVGPVTVTVPAETPEHDDILALLARLRAAPTQAGASDPPAG